MARYRVSIEKAASKEIRKIHPTDQRRIVRKLDELADDPRHPGCAPMRGSDLWKVRVGNYRIVYEIGDELLVVVVVRVRHRKDVYRKL